MNKLNDVIKFIFTTLYYTTLCLSVLFYGYLALYHVTAFLLLTALYCVYTGICFMFADVED